MSLNALKTQLNCVHCRVFLFNSLFLSDWGNQGTLVMSESSVLNNDPQ